jgi:hypothetical protein
MEVSKITELTVFESPDGGRTVYARRPGESARQLYSREPTLQKELDEMEQSRRWVEILGARKNNPGLDELCQQVEILYELSRKDS